MVLQLDPVDVMPKFFSNESTILEHKEMAVMGAPTSRF